jgi:hypothetical protein
MSFKGLAIQNEGKQVWSSQKKYNWKTITEKTFEVYEKAIEKQDPVMKTELEQTPLKRLMGEISLK